VHALRDLAMRRGSATMGAMTETSSGGALIVFVLAVVMIAGSLWTLFFRARLPIPAGLGRGVTRATLEVFNLWLADYGGWAGCFFLPIGTMLALGVIEGGMAFYHWPIALLMFAVLAVWKMR
jgi:hypothetical protein